MTLPVAQLGNPNKPACGGKTMNARNQDEKFAQSIEQEAEAMINRLAGELRRQEDAETAIDVYKTANWVIRRLEDVKDKALNLAERDMQQRDIEKLDTPVGSAGWTEPQAKELNEGAWLKAMARNPELIKIQSKLEAAQETLEMAQEPYRELPEPRFFIR
jgi:hypothetical protein